MKAILLTSGRAENGNTPNAFPVINVSAVAGRVVFLTARRRFRYKNWPSEAIVKGLFELGFLNL